MKVQCSARGVCAAIAGGQGGFVPERLGQARSEPDLPTFVRPEGHKTLPPVGRESRRDEERTSENGSETLSDEGLVHVRTLTLR